MSDSDEKAWGLFKNVVGLAKGAEEHAAEAEREACCVLVLGEGEERKTAIDMAFRHMTTAKRYTKGAHAYCQQLRALAESTGDSTHLRNAISVASRAEKAKAIATKAGVAVAAFLDGSAFPDLVCEMTGLS